MENEKREDDEKKTPPPLPERPPRTVRKFFSVGALNQDEAEAAT